MEEQQKKNKKILLTIVGVAIVVVALVGVTYAFFNYTRTGGANTVRTGRILFNTEEGENINLTNVFPVASGQASDNNPNVRTLNITVTGDTDYADGLEYLVTAEDVHMTTLGNKEVPLRVDISVSDIATGENAGSLGTEESGDYFANKASYKPNGNTAGVNKYKVLYTDNGSNSLNDGERLLVGYIAPNTTAGVASGVNGVIKIKVYFDGDRIAISDTYNETTPETDEYGTTTNWVRGRDVFTTSEWNALSSNGVSFKIKVEANEGQWVGAPVTTPPTCPGPQCVYTISSNNIDQQISGTLGTDYKTSYDDYGTYFLGHILDNGVIKESYACGINSETVFCIRGGIDEENSIEQPIYTDNVLRLNTAFSGCNATTSGSNAYCSGSVDVFAYPNGRVNVSGDDYDCTVDAIGSSYCS